MYIWYPHSTSYESSGFTFWMHGSSIANQLFYIISKILHLDKWQTYHSFENRKITWKKRSFKPKNCYRFFLPEDYVFYIRSKLSQQNRKKKTIVPCWEINPWVSQSTGCPLFSTIFSRITVECRALENRDNISPRGKSSHAYCLI